MLRHLFKRIRRVGYYSADHAATPWSRADDAAFVASLLLAIVATAASGRLYSQPLRDDERVIGVFEHDGTFHHQVLREPATMPNASDPAYRASLTLAMTVTGHGWPATIRESHAIEPAVLSVTGRPAIGSLEDLAPGGPTRSALERGLAELDPVWQAAARATTSQTHTASRWIGWLLCIGVWWVVALVVVLALLRVARLGMLVADYVMYRTYRKRQEQNLCPTCGYDLRGLEFAERCPECGDLVE